MPTELRDYFAGQAIIGLLAHSYGSTFPTTSLVATAYEVADMMLEEKKKPKE